jgi:hypothetical protein
MRTPSVIRAILVSTALLLSLRIHAATILWTNTAGGLWNIPANWSPNTVPGSGDTVYITNAGSYAVSVNVSATLGDFFVGSSAAGKL